MIILEDTRQQENKHKKKHEYFNSIGVRWTRTTLFCGDYTLPINQSICVDTKQNIEEVINDINVKALTKREISEVINQLYSANAITEEMVNPLIDVIYGDDTDRYPEDEISELLHKNGIEGYVAKCKVMQKTGKSNKCVKEFFVCENYSQLELRNILCEQGYIDKINSIKAERIRIEDVLQDLYVGRRGFFHRGLKRARKHNIKLYVLVENEDGIKTVQDLFAWQNPRMHRYNKIAYMHRLGKWENIPLPKAAPTNGPTLAKAMLTMQAKYGVEFHFCRPEEAGKRILELLEVDEDVRSDVD